MNGPAPKPEFAQPTYAAALADRLRNLMSTSGAAEDTGADIAAGFVPGLSGAQAARDFQRSSERGDRLGAALSLAGIIPGVGGITKIIKGRGAMKAAVAALRKGRKADSLVSWHKGLDAADDPALRAATDDARMAAETPTLDMDAWVRKTNPEQVPEMDAFIKQQDLIKKQTGAWARKGEFQNRTKAMVDKLRGDLELRLHPGQKRALKRLEERAVRKELDDPSTYE